MNPVRTCNVCSQTDDHPRHVFGLIGPTGVEVDQSPHLDCCATAFNCELCLAQLEVVGGVAGNPKGEALREYLVTTGPEADKPGWTAPANREG